MAGSINPISGVRHQARLVSYVDINKTAVQRFAVVQDALANKLVGGDENIGIALKLGNVLVYLVEIATERLPISGPLLGLRPIASFDPNDCFGALLPVGEETMMVRWTLQRQE